MANITAADVKKLRDATGAGMMDCKKALAEAEGDQDKAIEVLRVKGMKSMSKREGRDTANGLVAARTGEGSGVMIEVNCETDFVAKSDKFVSLADAILQTAVETKASTAEELLEATSTDGKKVAELLDDAKVQIGEKMALSRVSRIEAPFVESYLHKTNPDLPAQIGVLIGTDKEDAETARGVAMHAAAMAPRFLSHDEIDEATIAKERELIEANAREEGRPEQAMKNIVEGRLRTFFADVALLDQAYAKEPKKTVETILKEAGVTVTSFTRFRVGQTD